MKIRKATKKDIPKVLELAKDFIIEHRKISKLKEAPPIKETLNVKKKILQKDIRQNNGVILIAKEDSEFIGYIFAIKGFLHDRSAKTKVYVSDLFVKKELRKKRIANKLIIELFKWCKKEKVNEVFLDIDSHNKKAKKLYDTLKFKARSIKMSKKLK